MKTWAMAAALLFLGASSFAQSASTAPARRPCEDLKTEITKKLEAKGVTSYSLDAVDKGKEGDAKVVGSCDGGTKSIVYSRTDATSANPSDQNKPQ